jgi:hypothetical protein
MNTLFKKLSKAGDLKVVEKVIKQQIIIQKKK